jgi:hypothetical protein
MRMDEQVDYGTSETFSLTPRLIAVKGKGLESKTVFFRPRRYSRKYLRA